MLVGVLLSSLWAVSHAVCSCPDGSILAPGTGYGSTISETSYIPNSEVQCGSHSADTCRQHCESWLKDHGKECVAFTFDDASNKCRLFSKQEPIQTCGTTYPKTFVCLMKCELKVPETNVGNCWGDPHCTTFNGNYEHQQGFAVDPHHNAGDTYYLFKNCVPSDYDNLPFALSGRFQAWSGDPNSRTANIIESMWLELYDNTADGLKVYMMELSSDSSKNKYDGPYDKPTRCTYSNSWNFNTEYSFGTRFKVKVTGSCNNMELHLTVDGECTWNVKMIRGGAGGLARAPWHRIIVEQPSCWKCSVCGLFGDLQTTPKQTTMLACGGVESVSYPNSLNWAPNAHMEAWNDDWTWSTKNVENNCNGFGEWGAKGDRNNVIGGGSSSSSIEATNDIMDCKSDKDKFDVIAACQSEAIEKGECCSILAEDECSSLVTGCVADACAIYDTYDNGNSPQTGLFGSRRMRQRIRNIKVRDRIEQMNLAIDDACDDVQKRGNFAGLIPNLLYKFDGDLLESESFGSENFALTNNGLVVKDGLLQCSSGSSASVGLPDGLTSVSIEASVRVDSSNGGCIFSAFGVDVVYNADNTLTVGGTSAGDAGNEVIHIVAALDITTGSIEFFIDGVEKASFTANVNSASNTLKLCECGAGGNSNFDGEILQIAVFYKELGLPEAEELYVTRMPNVCKDSNDLEYESIGSHLAPGEAVQQGQCLIAPGKEYAILMKFDGSVVLQGETGENEIVAANTNSAYFEYSSDGKFAVYASDGSETEEIEKANNAAGFLVIGDHGAVIAFDEDGDVYYTYPKSTKKAQSSNVIVAPQPQPQPQNYENNYQPQEEEEWNDYNNNNNYEPEIAASTTSTTASSTSMFVYMLYITIVLLAVNVVCGMINCWNNVTSKQTNRYKVVSIDSTDVENCSDVEIQHLK